MFRFTAILAVIMSLGGLSGPAQAADTHKVVYHVSEID